MMTALAVVGVIIWIGLAVVAACLYARRRP